jgi:phosphoglycolate phosphatase
MKNYQLYIFDWQDTLLDCNGSGLFPKVIELIDYLHSAGIKVGLATNLGRGSLNDILELIGIGEKFDYIKTISECRGKPNPDMINSISLESGIDKANIVMIGDAPTDIEMARLAGVDGIGIANEDFNLRMLQLQKPLNIFASISELYDAIVNG